MDLNRKIVMKGLVSVIFLLILFYSSGLGQSKIAAVANPGKSDRVFELASSITQFGVTWYFDKDYTCGTFANGDYWVLGPVTITSISPSSVIVSGSRVINGSVINPETDYYQGFDTYQFGMNEINNYDASRNAARPGGEVMSPANPLIIDYPASLVSGISKETISANEHNNVHTMAVLTILNEIPEEGSFRPQYIGYDKTIKYNELILDYNKLGSLEPVAETPAISEVLPKMEKLWIDNVPNWSKEMYIPKNNLPNYGRDIAGIVCDAALLLNLNFSEQEKRDLLIRMVQIGIDFYGTVTSEPHGRIYLEADGGHHSGRIWPIIFAGFMLGDEDMMTIASKSGSYAYTNGYYEGNLPPDYIHFGELDQAFYVTQRDVDRTHSPQWAPDPRSVPIPYEQEDIGMPEWGINHAPFPFSDNANFQAIYRTTCGITWGGFTLASHILGITNLFNSSAFVDYVDRYMELTENQDGDPPAFHRNMWNRYRRDYGNPWSSTEDNENRLTTFRLEQNYPNPFNPGTIISYSLPSAGEMSLKIYNSLGQEVKTIYSGFRNAGHYKESFSAEGLASGVYYYRLNCGGHTESKRMILVK